MSTYGYDLDDVLHGIVFATFFRLMKKMPDFQGPGPLGSKCTANPRFPMSGELRDRAAGLLNLERELFGAWCSYLFRYLAKQSPNKKYA